MFIPAGRRDKIPHSENDEALEEGPEEAVEICILGNIQNFTGQGPEQPDLTLRFALLWAMEQTRRL